MEGEISGTSMKSRPELPLPVPDLTLPARWEQSLGHQGQLRRQQLRQQLLGVAEVSSQTLLGFEVYYPEEGN